MANSASLALKSLAAQEKKESAMATTDTVPTEAKKTKGRKRRTVKPGKATARLARAEKNQAVPTLDDLRLAQDGITGGKRNKYVNIAFANGYVVRLLPVNMPSKTECLKVRDLMVAWFNKRVA